MSSARSREALAPSMFPFLAVLLCTMGALVLILMLIVAGAQASTNKVAKEQIEKSEEFESQLQVAHRASLDQLEEGRIALEKKRLQLQHFESHIAELQVEMRQLRETEELLESEQSQATEEVEEKQLSELERQLAEAAEKLEKKQIKDPKGDKPIFAIIPYNGANGTHRRPIYLECKKEGVVIQPEGILLSVDDLKPPYGPGNPLDAALRTIRAEFSPADHAVTSTAYPLLVVRPTGITTYAMARNAMSGWDDQFGYELVSEELELVFPPSKPGLARKLASTIEIARERQAALVMAMPRKYGFGNVSANTTSHSGGFQGSRNSGGSQSYSTANVDPTQQFEHDLTSSLAAGNHGNLDAGDPNHPLHQAAGAGPVERFLGSAGNSSNPTGVVNEAGKLEGVGSGQFYSPESENLAGYGDTDPSAPNLYETGRNGSNSYFGGSAIQQGNQEQLTTNSTNNTASQGASSSSDSGGTAQGSSSSGSTFGSSQPSTGNQIEIPTFGMQPPANFTGQTTLGSSQANGGQYQGRQSPGDTSGTSQPSKQRTSNPSNGPRGGESTQPVASNRGRNWAAPQPHQTTAPLTPVSRSIRLRCTEDAWILLPQSATDSPITIDFSGTPAQRAERLANAISQRVKTWGIAIDGGYWKPELTVETTSDAKWRYDQLLRLFEGSGIDIHPATPTRK